MPLNPWNKTIYSEDDPRSWTIVTLKKALDARGVKYPARASKTTLLDNLIEKYLEDHLRAKAAERAAEQAAGWAAVVKKTPLYYALGVEPILVDCGVGIYTLDATGEVARVDRVIDEGGSVPTPTRQVGALSIGGGRNTEEWIEEALYKHPSAVVVLHADRGEVWS